MLNLSRVITLLFLCLSLPVQAANSLDILINEVAWMGSPNSSYDEWIELYNNGSTSVNLDGWIFNSLDENLKVSLKGAIPANGFYLLERTDDNTVLEIPADIIYKGTLNNQGGSLKLYDNSENLIDSADYAEGWPSGDNTSKKTMERKGLNVWGDSLNPGGSPKEKNSAVNYSVAEKQDQVKSNSISYPKGILINEVLASPEGPDDQNEWIEIFNQNQFDVDLSNWKLQDLEGTTKTYIFPEKTIITDLGFLVINRTESKIILNNDSDGLNLIGPDGKVVDSVNFQKAVRNSSYNRFEKDWVWSSILTPGKVNQMPAEQKEEAKEIKETNEIKEEKELIPEENLAQISQTIETNNQETPSSKNNTIIVSLIIAIFSGIIILLLKKKIKG